MSIQMITFFRRRRRILIVTLLALFLTAIGIQQHLMVATTTVTQQQHKEEYRPSIFIVAALRNSEPILDHWTTQVERLVAWAGPSRTFISVYENGSQDKTKELLGNWQVKLTDAGIQNKIVLDDANSVSSRMNTTGKNRRITKLAEIRNLSLEPLHSQSAGHFDKILYLNDIIFDVQDAIRLLTTRDGDYDAVCGMDFYGEFYDMFASREVDGKWVASGDYPYFADETSQKLLRASDLVPVYSCWNGIVAFNAKPFAQDQVEFRAVAPDEPDIAAEASECCLIFTDLRALDYTRIFIDPRVKVAYDKFHYWYARNILPIWTVFLAFTNHPTNQLSNAQEAEWTYRVNKAYEQGVDPRDYNCLWMTF
ncbi:cryptococcal mannosyltransferase 1-domain-containing protein [Zychaea mexicana]|uniref:cryptococcal mannosyltransferase 1-domain-containing protein n=1 Tax=Zychaea mexicana TaxID=64656 RepID=UPI0022FF1A7A|nr:cryptococcal mannosyltransferase 1-domain-containing protein [Zychaea mexicana]KAI9491020.1 cryptococcal mannosyltransferase 1-domain-containing protein [Zychaea mexicana]